jgi:hypothetical protein
MQKYPHIFHWIAIEKGETNNLFGKPVLAITMPKGVAMGVI